MKTEVGRREDEIENLRDAVEAENTKIVRLERLIKQYSSSDTGPTPSNPTASGSGKARVQDFSSNRSTASSYISAGSTTVSGASRLSAPRTRPERAVSGGVSGGGAAGLRGSTTREVESVPPSSSSRPSTDTRNRSLSSTSGQSGSTARAAALPTVADGLQQLRLNRTTGSHVDSGRAARGRAAIVLKGGNSGDDYEDKVDKSISYDLSDDEEPLPVPSWMKPSKY